MEKTFKFELGAKVQLLPSGESGIVVARGQYINATDSYFLRYVNAQGLLVEQWWSEEAIEPAREDAQ